MVFFVGVYVVAAFLLVIGIVCMWLGWREHETNEKGRVKIISGSMALVLFGFFYLGMAHWTVLAGNGLVIAEGNLAPCENLLNQTYTHINQTHQGVTDHVDEVTDYFYVDSCANRVTPVVVERAYKVYTTVLMIDGLGILLFSLVAIIMFIKRSVSW